MDINGYIACSPQCCTDKRSQCRRGFMRTEFLVLSLLLFLHQIPSCLQLNPPTYSLSEDMKTFHDSSTEYYRLLVTDDDDNVVYVGAKDYVFRLDGEDISNRASDKYKRSPKLSNQNPYLLNRKDECMTKGKNEEFECQNHVRTLVIKQDEIYVCGTGFFKPNEFTLNKRDLKVTAVGESNSGIAKCPLDPAHNSTFVYVRSGNPGGLPGLYSGTATSFRQSYSIIYRPQLSDGRGAVLSQLLTTNSQDSTTLNEPQFVGAFDVDSYVYFFFRETAVEFTNCGKAVFSRVARVCKSDQGGRHQMESRWTTFLKARLNCSIPGELAFYFSEIYDVVRIGNTFYGIFTTNLNGIYGSAVCAFDIKAIKQALDGSFKERRPYYWQAVPSSQVPTPRPGTCVENSTRVSDNVTLFINAHPLMDQAVQHRHQYPLYYKTDTVFQRIAVDTVQTYMVFFLGTNQGEIHKVVQWVEGNKVKNRLLTIWKPFPAEASPIWQMKLYRGKLIVSTDSRVVQFEVEQCHRYTTCTECITDPYCGWDSQTRTGKRPCRKYRKNFNISRNVTDGETIKLCNCVMKEKQQSLSVAALANPVHLHCESLCTPSQAIHWTFNEKRIDIDHQNYILTGNNGLVMMNISSWQQYNGTYQCMSGSTVLAKHYVQVTNCSDPSCVWRQEFSKWCEAFDSYKKEVNKWKCLKNQCLDDNECFPRKIAYSNKCHGR